MGRGVVWENRPQVGVLYRLARVRNIDLTGRTLFERHFRTDQAPDFNVYRQRIEYRGEYYKKNRSLGF